MLHSILLGSLVLAPSAAQAAGTVSGGTSVVLLVHDETDGARKRLLAFAESRLAPLGECTFLEREAGGELAPLDDLRGADLLVVLAESTRLGERERTALEAYVWSGRPLLLLRGERRAFEDWDEFQTQVAGANFLGYWEEHGPPTVRVLEDARTHPAAKWLFDGGFEATTPLARVLPLVDGATPLLEGRVPGVREAEPVAWTSGFQGGRVFVTTLGAPGDFERPQFLQLLSHATLWCLGRSPDEKVPIPPAPVLDEKGSTPLFDGETLEGWVTSGGRYDGNARWTVEDGAIVGRQGPGKAGGLIYTERPYKNFIVALETKIDYPFDSGVFLRMVPRGGGKGQQVTLDHRPGGEIGAIYADGFLEHNEPGERLYRRDGWNEVVIRCTGRDARVTTWLNGELLVDYATPDGTPGFAEEGLIGLQVHGGADTPETQRAMFRRIRIRELPDFDEELFEVDDWGVLSPTDAGARAGWRALFNGRDFSGWEPLPDESAYRIENAVIAFPVEGGGGILRTARDYEDFELRVDFRIAFMANSGLYLRSARTGGGNPSYSGCEVQILDDFNWEEVTSSTLQPYQLTGGLYGSVPPGVESALHPLGEWNTFEVRYVGTRLAVRLNGHLLYDVDTLEVPGNPPFAERVKRGFIGFQRHAPSQVRGRDYAWFRNIFIRELE